MKFLHISDLHLGKRLGERSLIEDQEYILNKIADIAVERGADAILAAGDIYDKAVPSLDAVKLFDDFLTGLLKENKKVYVISGNHDSAERIAFGGRIMQRSGIFMSPVYGGRVEYCTEEDEYGKITIYMLPFIKPSSVNRYSDRKTESFTDTMRWVTDGIDADTRQRNILLAHQYVTGALRSDSEEVFLGGAENVDANVFEKFDYVALGHLHRAQNCGSDRLRYCGTPLKYSFSECNDSKTATLVELREKGNTIIDTIPLKPLREMTVIKGKYEELLKRSFYENTTYREDFIKAVLTDEEDILDAAAKLSAIYKNLLRVEYDNRRTRALGEIRQSDFVSLKSPLELFKEFYKIRNGGEMTEEQEKTVVAMLSSKEEI